MIKKKKNLKEQYEQQKNPINKKTKEAENKMTEKLKKKKKNISLGNFIKNISKHFLSCFHFNFGRFNFGEPGEKLNC